nr:lipid A deacylase LpxR family protein [Desulfobulbaceae bacterium]
MFNGTDSNYTNGVKISLISPDLKRFVESGKLPQWSIDYVNKLPFINEPNLIRRVEFSLGQNMYTPSDIIRKDRILDDRPYAGWTYFGAAFHSKSKAIMDTFEFQFGLIGPESFAEESQKSVHELRNLQRPNGWDNQLKNEPGVAAIYERKWRLPFLYRASIPNFDSIAHAGGALGNVYTYANGGLEMRLGWNLPEDFGVSLIRPAGNTRFTIKNGKTAYIFGAVNGRAVLQDIFLDGNTFTDSQSVTKEPFVADFAGGLAIYFAGYKITWTQVLRSREFKEQPDNHSFGSLTLSFFY